MMPRYMAAREREALVAAAELATGIPRSEIFGLGRRRAIVSVRWCIWYVARELYGLSFPMIAEQFGTGPDGRCDHSSVMYGIRAMERLLSGPGEPGGDASVVLERVVARFNDTRVKHAGQS